MDIGIINYNMNPFYRMSSKKLLKAALNNSLDDVADAIKQGANVNNKDSTGSTPLIVAVKYNNPAIVRTLLANPDVKVDLVDEHGYSALSYLVKSNEITVDDKCQLIPVFLARSKPTVDVIFHALTKYREDPKYRVILEELLKVEELDNINKEYLSLTPLSMAIDAEGGRNRKKSMAEQFKISLLLIEKGADINCRLRSGASIFVEFANSKDTPSCIIEFFLYNKDFNPTDRDLEKLRGNHSKIFQVLPELRKQGIDDVGVNKDFMEFIKSRSRSRSSKSSSSRSSKSKGGSAFRKTRRR